MIGLQRRWRNRVIVLVLVLGAGAGAWFVWGRTPLPDPPMPPDIADAEVRQVIEKAHAKLLANRRSGTEWGQYGNVLLANLFDREADVCFAEAAQRDPKDPRWPYARGQIALKRNPDQAITLLATAADVARERTEYLQACALTLAEAKLERGDLQQAAALFEDQRKPPDPERAEYGLGLVAIARGDDTTAQNYFRLAAEHRCCRKQAKAQLARIARSKGDLNAAKQLESEANLLEQDPAWPDPYLDFLVSLQAGYRGLQRRISLLERDGKYAEALELYESQVKRERTCANLTGAGVNFARLKRYDDAIKYLREAVQLDAKDSNAHYTLALVLFTKWEVALGSGANPTDAPAAFREVVEQAKATTELKPDHARAYLFWGLALKYLKEYKAALEPLQRGLTIEPETFDLHLALGQVLAETGDRTGAEASLKTAQQLRPNDLRPANELAKLKSR